MLNQNALDNNDKPLIIRDFLTYMETIKGKSSKTVNEYYWDLRMFFRFMKIYKGNISSDASFNNIPINDITIDFITNITLSDVYSFLNFIAKERPIHQNSPKSELGLSARSRARKISSLRSFFKYLTDKAQLLEINPISNLDLPSVKKTLPIYLSIEDSLKLVENVNGPNKVRDYCILVMFLNCGLRVSELVGLNLTDIQGDNLRILGKGNKERILYINEACRQALEAYYPVRIKPIATDSNAIFTSQKHRRISTSTVKWLVKKYITAAGLDSQKYSTHKLRHTAATLMYQNGVDIRTLQDVLGHEQVNTTMIYTHIEDENVREAVNKNPLAGLRPPKNNSK